MEFVSFYDFLSCGEGSLFAFQQFLNAVFAEEMLHSFPVDGILAAALGFVVLHCGLGRGRCTA